MKCSYQSKTLHHIAVLWYSYSYVNRLYSPLCRTISCVVVALSQSIAREREILLNGIDRLTSLNITTFIEKHAINAHQAKRNPSHCVLEDSSTEA